MKKTRIPVAKIKDCIKYIVENTGGGAEYQGMSTFGGHRVYTFYVPRRTWAPTTYFTSEELRFAFNFGW